MSNLPTVTRHLPIPLSEARKVICQQEMDLDHNKFVVRRIDTGEIVEERPLTADDHEDPDAEVTLGSTIKEAQEQAV